MVLFFFFYVGFFCLRFNIKGVVFFVCGCIFYFRIVVFFVLDGMLLELLYVDLVIFVCGEGWLNNGIEVVWCFLGVDGCYDFMLWFLCVEEVCEGGGGFWGE